MRYLIIFKSKTFNIIFSLIFILGCLIYSSALFINFYWYWMLRPQICFIWSCLLCQSLHHYHRKIISLISKVTKFVYTYIDDIIRKTVQLRIYIMQQSSFISIVLCLAGINYTVYRLICQWLVFCFWPIHSPLITRNE